MVNRLKIIALLLFVMVDVVAVGLAIKHVNRAPDVKGSAVVVPSSSPSTTTPTSTTAKVGAPTGLATLGPLVATYAAGSCDAPGTEGLSLSVDKGAKFNEIALPLEAKANSKGNRAVAITSILGVDVTSARKLTLFGTDNNCKAVRYTTTDAGQNWTLKGSIGGWYVAQGKVGTPAGVVNAQCEATSVWPISDRNAKVACKNGEIRGTDDVGQTWVSLGSLTGLQAATFDSLRAGFGVAKDGSCDSRAYSTGSAGGNWKPLGCIDKSRRATAISGDAGTLIALVGGKIYSSSDAGASWSKS